MLYVFPIVTLSSKNNVNLSKQLNEGFERSVYWNAYKSDIIPKNADNNNFTRLPLDASFERLFVLAFNNVEGDDRVLEECYKKYFFPRVNITMY